MSSTEDPDASESVNANNKSILSEDGEPTEREFRLRAKLTQAEEQLALLQLQLQELQAVNASQSQLPAL
ncbi:hypothetical protein TKK_0014715 [Trichogramma kaykai]